MGKNREVCTKMRQGVRSCNHCISPEENHVLTIRIEGNCEIHCGQMMAAKCPHWKDEIGMQEGYSQ
jgi:hypothetical protein